LAGTVSLTDVTIENAEATGLYHRSYGGGLYLQNNSTQDTASISGLTIINGRARYANVACISTNGVSVSGTTVNGKDRTGTIPSRLIIGINRHSPIWRRQLPPFGKFTLIIRDLSETILYQNKTLPDWYKTIREHPKPILPPGIITITAEGRGKRLSTNHIGYG
jgi:hypothetical protein